MNFVKFLRTPFFTEHLRWLLLKTDATNLVVLSSEDEDKKLSQTDSINEFTIHDLWFTQVNPKKPGWGWSIWPRQLWFFEKYSFYRKGEALFFVTFNIIISHIFSENFIEIP